VSLIATAATAAITGIVGVFQQVFNARQQRDREERDRKWKLEDSQMALQKTEALTQQIAAARAELGENTKITEAGRQAAKQAASDAKDAKTTAAAAQTVAAQLDAKLAQIGQRFQKPPAVPDPPRDGA
jgi:hypothetical protein